MKGKILIVDDDLSIRKVMRKYFEARNYTVYEDNGNTVLSSVKTFTPDVVFLDVYINGENRLNLLSEIKSLYPHIRVIIITGQSSYQVAVDAIKNGADEYLLKPVNLALLEKLIDGILSEKAAHAHMVENKTDEIVGKSKSMQEVFVKIGKASILDVPVLITGETGTGKELVARAIHKESGKNDFIAINCSSIPPSLLETELFGYEKGAFSGADKVKKGLIELANEGTLLLDEIGDMPLELQAKLLRVLEEKEFFRIGGEKKISVNFRLICATNRYIERMIEEGEFREDLYYRISAFKIHIPPLRERKEDIPELSMHFISISNQEYGTEITGIETQALNILTEYHFPGNVRELQNIITVLCLNKKKGLITERDIQQVLKRELTSPKKIPDRLTELLSSELPLPELLRYVERIAIETALKKSGGNKQKTAKLLGIHRNTLFKKIKELNIET